MLAAMVPEAISRKAFIKYLILRCFSGSFRVVSSPSIIGRARVYGVSFATAVQKISRERFQKAVFWTDHPCQSGVPAQLLVHLWRRKASNGQQLSFEGWQWIGEGEEVNYGHMIMAPDGNYVTHVDGALITFEDENAVNTMFQEGEKRKGVAYEKYFRLDGRFLTSFAMDLIGAFFPNDETLTEYFSPLPDQ